MNQLSDEDLRRQLMCFGEDVGPLSDSIRPYWEKRLALLMQPDNNKKKSSQAGSTKKEKSTVLSCPTKNRISHIGIPLELQQSDKKLIEALKELGVKVPRGTLNDELRTQYQKKLDSLMPQAKKGNRAILKREFEPPESETVNYLKDFEHIDDFNALGIDFLLEEVNKQASQENLMAGTSRIGPHCDHNKLAPASLAVRSRTSSEILLNHLKDLETIDKLNAFGMQPPLERRNEVNRYTSQEKLMVGSSRIGPYRGHHKLTPTSLTGRRHTASLILLEHVNHLKDNELIEHLKAYGVSIPSGPLNDTTRGMWKNVLCDLMSGVSAENGV